MAGVTQVVTRKSEVVAPPSTENFKVIQERCVSASPATVTVVNAKPAVSEVLVTKQPKEVFIEGNTKTVQETTTRTTQVAVAEELITVPVHRLILEIEILTCQQVRPPKPKPLYGKVRETEYHIPVSSTSPSVMEIAAPTVEVTTASNTYGVFPGQYLTSVPMNVSTGSATALCTGATTQKYSFVQADAQPKVTVQLAGAAQEQVSQAQGQACTKTTTTKTTEVLSCPAKGSSSTNVFRVQEPAKFGNVTIAAGPAAQISAFTKTSK